jgi:uncharacterized membrane protein (DUF485 family)
MTDKLKSDYTLGVLLVFVAAYGGHWLITPINHPNATTLDYLFTWGQIVVCLVAGIRLIRRSTPQVSAS